MQMDDVSPALRERLGLEGTVGLLNLLETVRQEWSAEVTSLAIERFERRLTAEASGLRIALVESTAALRYEFKQELAALRSELKQDLAALRSELTHETSSLRVEMQKLHVSTLRWMFAFWVGQMAAFAATVAVMFQIYSI